MPHSRKLRNTFIQILFLSILVAITGNFISNYQERRALRNEIFIIRNSLHHLKDTINKIATTYDHLYNDVASFVTAENTKLPIDVNYLKISHNKATDNTESNKLFILEHINDVNKDNIKQYIPPQRAKNATTITRNPLVATGVGSEPITYQYALTECKKVGQSESNIHKCYKNIKSCSCY